VSFYEYVLDRTATKYAMPSLAETIFARQLTQVAALP